MLRMGVILSARRQRPRLLHTLLGAALLQPLAAMAGGTQQNELTLDATTVHAPQSSIRTDVDTANTG